jgi:hypothetical protein
MARVWYYNERGTRNKLIDHLRDIWREKNIFFPYNKKDRTLDSL